MNKYSEQQILEAVSTYRSGELGLRIATKLHNVGFTSLRNWLSRHEALGELIDKAEHLKEAVDRGDDAQIHKEFGQWQLKKDQR